MLLRRIARPMLASMFISGGLAMLRAPQGHVQAAKPVLDAAGPAIDRAVELAPIDRPEDETLVRIDAGLKVVAGTMLAFGRFPRLASTVLAGSLIPTTLAGHRFWESTDPVERQAQQVHFVKNVGLLGGLMIAAADTAGRPSLGWRGRRAARLAAVAASAQAGALSGAAADLRGRASGTAAGLAGLAPGAAISARTSALSSRASELQGEVSRRAAKAVAKAEKRGAKLQRDAAKRSAKLQKRAAKRGAAWQKAAAAKRLELERAAANVPGVLDSASAQASRLRHDVAARSSAVGQEIAKQADGVAKDARKRMAALSR